jgi:hypothetical protein
VTIGFTPEQDRRLDELVRVRSRRGEPLTKADLIRDAVTFYFMHQDDLPGSRKAIARSMEGRIAEVDQKLDYLTETLENFIARITTRKT